MSQRVFQLDFLLPLPRPLLYKPPDLCSVQTPYLDILPLLLLPSLQSHFKLDHFQLLKIVDLKTCSLLPLNLIGYLINFGLSRLMEEPLSLHGRCKN
jgi:hypothetical protein